VNVRCPHCNTRLFQKGMDGRIKCRTPILIFDEDGAAIVVCRKCKQEVDNIDVHAGNSLQKSLSSPKLVINPAKIS
jgi:DNA-directed RNA polymerase subunit RPC12/RpoP